MKVWGIKIEFLGAIPQTPSLKGGDIGVADYAITPKNPANYAITPKNGPDYAITPLLS